MLCGDAMRETWKEEVLCDPCEAEFRKLFGRRRLRVPLTSVDDVRQVAAFVATQIYSNIRSLEELAERVET